MDVVEDEDQRALAGQALEQLPYRPERPVGARFRVARADGAGQPLRDRVGVGLISQQLPDRLPARLGSSLPDDLGERPERDPVAVRHAAAGEDAGAGVRARDELTQQRRLPDPGRPEDGEQVRGALAHGPLVGLPQLGELEGTAEHDPVDPPADRSRVRRHGDDAPGGSVAPAPRPAVGLFELGRALDRTARGLVHEDVADGGGGRERCGARRRVPRDQRSVQLRLPDEHVAGRDAERDIETYAEDLLQLARDTSQPPAELDRRADGPHRVVLVHGWDAEQRERRFARLLDRGTVACCDGLNLGEDAGRDESGRLRIERPDSGADGERRHGLADLPLRGRRLRRNRGGRSARGCGERRVLHENRPLEGVQRGARLDPELIDEELARPPVHLEGVRLATRTVEGEHKLAGEPLMVRVRRGEGFELADDGVVPTELELRLDPVGQRREPLLCETLDVGERKRLQLRSLERVAAPEPQRLTEQRRAGFQASGCERCATLGDPALELGDVEGGRLHAEHVAGPPGDEQALAARLGLPQRAPELRDVDLEIVDRRLGRARAPERLDQSFGADDAVRVEGQQPEQRAELAAAQLDSLAVGDRFDRPEYPKLHVPRSIALPNPERRRPQTIAVRGF